MRRNKLSLYVHFVWTTWDRLPLITPAIERALYRNIIESAQSLGCRVLAINGVEDHVHVFLALPSTVSIAELVQKMKGASAHFVNNQMALEYHFKWQGFYGAFSVSRWDISKIINYIKNQKEHHANDDLWPEFETAFEHIDPRKKSEESTQTG
jgi:REP element-mobilizing transposase RayT